MLRPLLLALAAGSAQAWEFEGQALSGHYHAEERLASGALANTEAGRLNGGRLGGFVPLAGGQLGLQLMQLGGHVDYTGRSQNGFPVNVDTRLRWQELGLSWGRPWGTDPDGPWAWRATLGQRRLDRRIGAGDFSSALNEVLNSGLLRLSASGALALAPGWRLRGELGVEQGFNGRLAVDFVGQADPARLAVGSRNGWALDLALQWQPAPRWRAALGWQERHFRFGASDEVPYAVNGVVQGTLRYPGSSQRLGAVALSLGIQLD